MNDKAQACGSDSSTEFGQPDVDDAFLIRAADMLTAYAELIRRDGASHIEEHHYLPEVEFTAQELRRAASWTEERKALLEPMGVYPNPEAQRAAAGGPTGAQS